MKIRLLPKVPHLPTPACIWFITKGSKWTKAWLDLPLYATLESELNFGFPQKPKETHVEQLPTFDVKFLAEKKSDVESEENSASPESTENMTQTMIELHNTSASFKPEGITQFAINIIQENATNSNNSSDYVDFSPWFASEPDFSLFYCLFLSNGIFWDPKSTRFRRSPPKKIPKAKS